MTKPQPVPPTDAAARRQQVDVIRKWGPRLARAMLLLAVVSGVILWKFGVHLEANTVALQRRVVLGCHRTNVERKIANEQNFADYNFFKLTLGVFKGILLHPKTPQDDGERKVTEEFVTSLERETEVKAYVPLTFCGAHAKPGELFVPPEPVPFALVGGEPPKSAFTLQKGQ